MKGQARGGQRGSRQETGSCQAFPDVAKPKVTAESWAEGVALTLRPRASASGVLLLLLLEEVKGVEKRPAGPGGASVAASGWQGSWPWPPEGPERPWPVSEPASLEELGLSLPGPSSGSASRSAWFWRVAAGDPGFTEVEGKGAWHSGRCCAPQCTRHARSCGEAGASAGLTAPLWWVGQVLSRRRLTSAGLPLVWE